MQLCFWFCFSPYFVHTLFRSGFLYQKNKQMQEIVQGKSLSSLMRFDHRQPNTVLISEALCNLLFYKFTTNSLINIIPLQFFHFSVSNGSLVDLTGEFLMKRSIFFTSTNLQQINSLTEFKSSISTRGYLIWKFHLSMNYNFSLPYTEHEQSEFANTTHKIIINITIKVL